MLPVLRSVWKLPDDSSDKHSSHMFALDCSVSPFCNCYFCLLWIHSIYWESVCPGRELPSVGLPEVSPLFFLIWIKVLRIEGVLCCRDKFVTLCHINKINLNCYSHERNYDQRCPRWDYWYCVCPELGSFCTCSSAHAPGGQAVRRREAVKHANILRCQELHKLAVLEHVPFAVEDGGSLIRNVDDPSCDERHCYCKNVLLRTQNPNFGMSEETFTPPHKHNNLKFCCSKHSLIKQN